MERESTFIKCFIRLNRIIVIITRRAQERTAMNTEGSNRIIEDSKNGVTLVTRSERTKVVVQTKFASTIVIPKRFRSFKKGLQEIVISDQRYSYKEDEINKALFVEETLLSGIWWDKVDYILAFTTPIYDLLYFALKPLRK